MVSCDVEDIVEVVSDPMIQERTRVK
jgi:hypothetical protein